MKVKRKPQFEDYLMRQEEKRKIKEEIKLLVYQYYSGSYPPKCVICGYYDIRALCIDHVNGRGNEHKKKENIWNMYLWLYEHNFPDGFQVLCMNCNWIKRRIKNETQERYTKENHEQLYEQYKRNTE